MASTDDLRINAHVAIPSSELTWRFSKSSGPGGQSVNTTDSRAEVVFDVAKSPSLSPHFRARALERLAPRLSDGKLTVSASRERSQYQNRQAALRRLTELLAEALRPPTAPRRATKPSRASVDRRISEKKQRAQTKKMRRTYDD